MGVLHVSLRNDVTLVVLCDSHQTVHFVDLLTGHANRLGNLLIAFATEVDVTHVRTHSSQATQNVRHDLGITCGEQLSQVFHRNTQSLNSTEEVVAVLSVVALLLEQVDNRGQRRHVPNHRHGAVLGVQGQSHLPLLGQLVHGRLLSRSNPRIGDVVLTRLLNHGRVVRIKHQRQLSLVEILLVRNRSSLGHTVCVVQEDTDVAHTTHAGLSTHGRDTSLNTGVAEGTLLSLTRLVVEVHLLVGATGDALTPTTATVLVHQHDTVLGALVDSAGGAGSHAGGV